MRLPILLLLLSVSCSSKKSDRPNKSASVPTQSIDAASQKATSQAQDAGTEFSKPSPTRVPAVPGVKPLTNEQVSAARVAEAKLPSSLGRKAHRAGDYNLAIEHFKKSLALDPGALKPRYNLACALLLSGQDAQALTLLDQFRNVDCPDCSERLARARVDKDWQSLWDDPRFLKIVIPAAEGNIVGIGYFETGFPRELEAAAFTLRPRLVLDRRVGPATIPDFELVLNNSQGEIARAAMQIQERKGAQVIGRIKVPGVGRYELSLVAGKRVYSSTSFEIRQGLCFGAEKHNIVDFSSLTLGTDLDYDGSPVYVGGEEEVSASLEWDFPLPRDDNYNYLAVWKRNGKTEEVSTFQVHGSTLGKHVDCPIGHPEIDVEAKSSAGDWMLGLYSQRGKSFEIRYGLRRGVEFMTVKPSLKILSKPPAWTARHFAQQEVEDNSHPAIWNGKGKASSTRLIRAVTRSPVAFELLKSYEVTPSAETAQALLALAAKHGGPWKASELPTTAPWPLVQAKRRQRPLPQKGCTASRCSTYPAVSADGKTLVTYVREEIQFWDETDECMRPEGRFLRFWDVASEKQVTSQDLSGFTPMSCTSAKQSKLEAGHTLRFSYADDDIAWTLKIKDEQGATVKTIKEDGRAADYCVSPETRVVVARMRHGSTDCHETEPSTFRIATY